jgi:uncharacterized membrane protein
MAMTDQMEHLTRQRAGRTPQRDDARRGLARRPPERQVRAGSLERRAVGLGWFSIGLGLAQLIAPRRMARLIGADHEDANTFAAVMAVGIRELACGIGLLTKSRPAAWTWARLGGDIMDLALLGYIWKSNPISREKVLGAGSAVLGVTLADAQTALELSRSGLNPLADGIWVKQSITVQKDSGEAYSFFRDLSNLPRFMSHLDSVVEQGARSRWRAKGPLGANIEWEAEIAEDRPGELIAWRSLPGADIPNRGIVRFRAAPGRLGTEIVVELSYDPPLGAVGAAVAKLFGREPAQEISADLRRLKQVLETGEVLHSDASIHRGMHPARPAPLSAPHARQVKS